MFFLSFLRSIFQDGTGRGAGRGMGRRGGFGLLRLRDSDGYPYHDLTMAIFPFFLLSLHSEGTPVQADLLLIPGYHHGHNQILASSTQYICSFLLLLLLHGRGRAAR